MEPTPVTRCQHLHTAGTQCGSPALRGQQYCYYHQENPPRPLENNAGSESSGDPQLLIPVLEDAHSIQVAIRQIMQALVQKKLDSKTAGLLLYALQIASSNLNRMDDEKPQPEQVVIDLDKIAETPLETDFFDEPDESADANDSGGPAADEEIPEELPPPPPVIRQESVQVCIYPDFERSLIPVDRLRAAIAILQKGVSEYESKMPKSEVSETRMPEKSALQTSEDPAAQSSQDPASGDSNQDPVSSDSNDNLPPGTIQACARMPRREKRSEERVEYVN
ncbi:MAG: hypothetical protein WBS24_02295 [Terriglobales bacterium]